MVSKILGQFLISAASVVRVECLRNMSFLIRITLSLGLCNSVGAKVRVHYVVLFGYELPFRCKWVDGLKRTGEPMLMLEF